MSSGDVVRIQVLVDVVLERTKLHEAVAKKIRIWSKSTAVARKELEGKKAGGIDMENKEGRGEVEKYKNGGAMVLMQEQPCFHPSRIRTVSKTYSQYSFIKLASSSGICR